MKKTVKAFGVPNEQGGYLVKIDLPYPMRLAWDKTKVIKSIKVHKLVENNFKNVFKDLLEVYGYEKIKELGIDLFGGSYNFRPMRGTEERYEVLIKAKNFKESYSLLSKHAWGVAIDLDPERNKLRETKKTARFARKEYKKMIDIFYKNGFISLGVEKDYDWMHFEIKH